MSQITWSNVISYGTWFIPFNLILTSFVVAFLVWNPKYFLKIYVRCRIWYYGFSKKEIQCDGLTISYIEHGHYSEVTPSVLLVHGFTSQKENWIDMMRNFPSQMHVLALDQPGHGDSEYNNETLSINFLTKTVKKFVDNIGLSKRKFHLVGQSMGGCISGIYACWYPDDLLSVSLFCPFGVPNKITEEAMSKYKSTGILHLLPQNMEELQLMLDVLTHKKVPLPDLVKHGLLHMRLEKDGFYKKLCEALTYDMDIFEKSIHEIKTPTLVLWGKQDKIIDVKCVEIIEKKLQTQHKKIVVLDKVGHTLSVEAPKKSAEVVLEFIYSL